MTSASLDTATHAATHVATRRERARSATIQEIKDTALRLMREQGTTDVRFSDIAREMGMTAPALYRYFGDSDELLTALIVDAYDALGDAVATARDAVDPADVTGRMMAVAEAYRSWARAEPQRFALILGMPVPGFAAPPEGPVTEAAARAMVQLKSLFFDAAAQGRLGAPLTGPAGTGMVDCMSAAPAVDLGPPEGAPLPPDTMQALLHVWSALHGFTCLETYGHLDWLTDEAREEVFTSLGRFLAKASGLPVPDRVPDPASASDPAPARG